jgi:hypothetical protein
MSNLPTNPAGQNTNSYFAGYYTTTLPVNGQQYDAVLTFFLKKTSGNRVAAESLTASVMTIAQNKGLDPISFVEEFKRYKDNESFKAALLAFLNSDRRPTSKLGYSVIPEANPFIVRNIGK